MGSWSCDEAWTWRSHARCRDEDPSLFFHPDGERGKARVRRQGQAKSVCATCPVTRQCAEHALAYQEAFGIWGGLSEEDRCALLNPTAVNIRTHRSAGQTTDSRGAPPRDPHRGRYIPKTGN